MTEIVDYYINNYLLTSKTNVTQFMTELVTHLLTPKQNITFTPTLTLTDDTNTEDTNTEDTNTI
jgi:hypothetical protein